MKKILKPDFILFAVITLALWIASAYVVHNFISPDKSYSILEHNYIDQHTRQALAWQAGRLDIGQTFSYLELAIYKGKVYNSFPPVTTLIEFPLTLIFKENTPNNLVMIIFIWLAMLFTFFILEKLTGNRLLSYVFAFTFYWGSNIYYLSLAAPVWHQGHIYGLFFAVTAFLVLVYSRKATSLIPGALCLGLAIGCRPFYFLFIPLYIYLAAGRYSLKNVLICTVIGLLPPGLFIGILNYARFGSPFNFGHVYLPFENKLADGVFGFSYLPRNAFSAFLRLPMWDNYKKFIIFNGHGTSVFIISPVIFLGLYALVKRKVPFSDKTIVFLTLIAVWFLLLMHHGNGWFQFGYRYSVDIILLLVIFFGWSFKKLQWWMIPFCVYSVAANFYGAVWFYYLNNL